MSVYYNFSDIGAQTKEFVLIVVSVKQAYVTGYVVLGASAVATVALTLVK